MFKYKTLEIVITDFCNLSCKLCSQGTPLKKDKKVISLKEIRRISKYFKPYEFSIIKISGGEPTLHPEFADICRELRQLFPARFYILATNGFLLEKYIEVIRIFNRVDLSNYPGKNDEIYEKILRHKLSNVEAHVKKDYTEMVDIFQKNNLHEINVFKECQKSYPPYPPYIKKIVQDRIYKCCNIFGQSLRQGIDINNISIKIDENWRELLSKINIEKYCKRCFFNVNASHGTILQKIKEMLLEKYSQLLISRKNIFWKLLDRVFEKFHLYLILHRSPYSFYIL